MKFFTKYIEDNKVAETVEKALNSITINQITFGINSKNLSKDYESRGSTIDLEVKLTKTNPTVIASVSFLKTAMLYFDQYISGVIKASTYKDLMQDLALRTTKAIRNIKKVEEA